MSATVSVIVSSYNRAPLLEAALRSVLAQTMPALEIIVADDGSTDDSAARVAALHGPIRFLALPHSGRPESVRNVAARQARGAWLAFLDDDDLWRPDKLARQLAAAAGRPAPSLLFCDAQRLLPDGRRSAPVLTERQRDGTRCFDELLDNCFVHPSAVLIHRSLWARVGPFSEQLFSQADYDLWARAAFWGRAACVPAPLLLIRTGGARLSHERERLHFENGIRVLEGLAATLPLTRAQRRRLRRTRARWHTHLARGWLAAGARRAARQQLRAALRHDPLQRALWRTLPAALRP